MANLRAIHSVGSSLVAYLSQTFPQELQNSPQSCSFKLFSSVDMTSLDNDKIVSLYLYRITRNEHLRNTGSPADPNGLAPLSLNLHFLLSVWASDALTEQLVFAWALRQLHQHETLTLSELSPDGGWGPGDFVQVIPAELSSEDMSRIWISLSAKYRLSVSYIARVVRIDPDEVAPGRPVIARRIGPRRARGSAMNFELADSRVLGALRFIDAATRLPVGHALRVESLEPAGVRFLRNRSGYYVLTHVPGLTAHTEAFASPPDTPPPGSMMVRLAVADPVEQYLPRLFALPLPREREREPGNADSLFRAVEVPMFPAPAAYIETGVAKLRVSISGTRGGSTMGLGGALVRVLRKKGDAVPLARGLSDSRGEALVAVVGIPTMTWSDGNEEHAMLSAGALVNLELMFDPQAQGFPDPDRLDTLSSLLPETAVNLIAGQETIVSLKVALP